MAWERGELSQVCKVWPPLNLTRAQTIFYYWYVPAGAQGRGEEDHCGQGGGVAHSAQQGAAQGEIQRRGATKVIMLGNKMGLNGGSLGRID